MKEQLDLLFALACEYGISDEDMSRICRMCGIDFKQLQQHSI